MIISLGLGGIFYAIILLVNAVAILSEDRFLARVGLSNAVDPGFGGVQDNTSIRARAVNLMASVRTLMRVPLIGINTLIIIYELI